MWMRLPGRAPDAGVTVPFIPLCVPSGFRSHQHSSASDSRALRGSSRATLVQVHDGLATRPLGWGGGGEKPSRTETPATAWGNCPVTAH